MRLLANLTTPAIHRPVAAELICKCVLRYQAAVTGPIQNHSRTIPACLFSSMYPRAAANAGDVSNVSFHQYEFVLRKFLHVAALQHMTMPQTLAEHQNNTCRAGSWSCCCCCCRPVAHRFNSQGITSSDILFGQAKCCITIVLGMAWYHETVGDTFASACDNTPHEIGNNSPILVLPSTVVSM